LKFIGLPAIRQSWHDSGVMAKSKNRDFFVNARRVVELAIGEQMDGRPLPDPDAGKNPAAVALSKLGASKGGKARAAKLSDNKRSEIAKKAAKARWSKQQEQSQT
jgi:hypothetical protein